MGQIDDLGHVHSSATVRLRTLISAAFLGSGFERFRTAQGLFAQWFLDMATEWVYNFGDGKERGKNNRASMQESMF